MATRATIKVEGISFAKVYKHFDGYPDGMLPWLTTFNKDFTKNRGSDPAYKFAQLLRSSKNKEFDLDDSIYTGYGVVEFDTDCGEEYEYILHKDGTVTYKKFYF